MNEEVEAVASGRGGPSRCAKRRGARANRKSLQEPPGHCPNDGSNEAAAPLPPPSPPTASTSTLQQNNLDVVVKDEFLEVVTNNEFLEVVIKDEFVSPGDKIAHLTNYGSEVGSDESDDDEDMLYGYNIPRVIRSMLETTMDLDEDDPVAFDQPAAGEPETAPNPALTSDPMPAIVPSTVTDKPWSWCDFEWKEFPTAPIPPGSRRETFSESNVGPATPRDDPYDIFVDIWDRKIMEHIASETNRYAQQVSTQMLRDHSLLPNSRIGQWRDTTADELYVYFGLVLAMGIVVKSRLEEYWGSSLDVFYTPGFSAHMSSNRFVLLTKCLHFNNNEDMCALELDGSEAHLFKLQPLLTHLNMKFQSMYTPARNLALDESLLMWKGWQLKSNEAARVGIKSYEICESQTGYLWRFEVHSRKKSLPQQIEDPLKASTPSVVLRLIHGLEHKGYTLWMDSFYNSPCLARRLKCFGFDCVGTLRTDRKFIPQALHSLTKEDMRPGQITGLTSGDVDIMVWRDNNRVAMISTYHGNAQQTIGNSTKPILIHDYNIMMGGVDKKDQMLAMYPIEWKRTKVWYKKIFRRLLNVSILNAYVIHRHSFPSSSVLSHRNFRILLVNSLFSKHCSPNLRPATTQNLNQTQSCLVHHLAEYPFGNTKVKHQRQRRKCANCARLVQTFCVGCSKTMCMDPCFLVLHS